MERLTREQFIERIYNGEKDFSNLDLSNSDLSNLDLSHLKLDDSDLSFSDLTGANLSNASLVNADLIRAKIVNSNLAYADLSYADLDDADLNTTDFYCADLHDASLRGTDLSFAILAYTNLNRAGLENAQLYKTFIYKSNLKGSYLEYANLFGAKLDEEEQIRKGLILKKRMIGYKKCRNNVIVTLEIPKGAIVFSINNKQCRTNKAKVVDISDGYKIVVSLFDDSYIYELGKKIEIEDFNLMYNAECATGIHFFKTIEEAKNF